MLFYVLDVDKPLVLLNPQSSSLNEGDSVLLECSANSSTSATYSWYKNKKMIPNQESSELSMSSLSFVDSGNYTCRIENKFGRKESNQIFLDVKCECVEHNIII